MRDLEFRADLTEVRLRIERMLSQPLSVEQLAALGTECQTQQQAVIDALVALGYGGWRPGM